MELNRQDKMLVGIACGFTLYILGNLYGEYLINITQEFFKHIF